MKNIAVTVCLSVIALSALGGDMSNSIELTQLYIVGDATHTAWDLGKADEMHRIDKGVFEWTGELAGGKDFKFMNSRDGWHKHIVATSGEYITWPFMPTGGWTESMTASSTWPGRADIPSSPISIPCA